MKSFPESLVNKLASTVEQQWNAAVDQIREEPVPNWALSMGNGDPRIAKVIYLKARLKQEFPVSFYQANYPNANYTPGQPPAYQTLGGMADLPPKATYLKGLLCWCQLHPEHGARHSSLTCRWVCQPASNRRPCSICLFPEAGTAASSIPMRISKRPPSRRGWWRGNVQDFRGFVGQSDSVLACPYGNDELNAPLICKTHSRKTSSRRTYRTQSSAGRASYPRRLRRWASPPKGNTHRSAAQPDTRSGLHWSGREIRRGPVRHEQSSGGPRRQRQHLQLSPAPLRPTGGLSHAAQCRDHRSIRSEALAEDCHRSQPHRRQRS